MHLKSTYLCSMKLELTTPALLFSTISLLMLAYTHRFLAVARLIRDLHDKYLLKPSELLEKQISNLRRRVILIRNMQLLAIASLFFSALCMFLLFAEYSLIYSTGVFSVSLIMLCISLGFSVWEIMISINALKWELSDMEIKSKSIVDKIIDIEMPIKKGFDILTTRFKQ